MLYSYWSWRRPCSWPRAAQAAYIGKMVDAKTKAPVEGALITLGAEVAHTGKDGTFRIESSGETLKLRAPGYARREIATAELKEPNAEIPLTPFQPRALYLTVYGAWSSKIRAAALETIEKNRMNALVIDIKGDRGLHPLQGGPAPGRRGARPGRGR